MSFLYYFTLLCLFLFALLVVYCWEFIRWEYISRFEKPPLPPGPPSYPIIGSLLSIAGDKPFWQSYTPMVEKYGPIMRVWLGTNLTVIITDVEIAKKTHIDMGHLTADLTHLSLLNSANSNPFGWASPAKQPIIRNVCIGQALGPGRQLINEPVIQEECDLLIQQLEKYATTGEVFSMEKELYIFSMNLMSRLLLSRRLVYRVEEQDTRTDEERESSERIVKIVSELQQILFVDPPVWEMWRFLRFIPMEGFGKTVTRYHEKLRMLMEEVDLIRKRRQETNGTEREIVDMLDAISDEAEKHSLLSRMDVAGGVCGIMLGGYDTASRFLAYLFTNVIKFPDFQEKMAQEMRQVVGDRTVSLSDRRSLTFTDAFLKESIRRDSPASFSAPHKVSSDIVIEGVKIPAGCQVMLGLRYFNHDPKVWENPEEFNPFRFVESNKDWVFTWSMGPRACPGNHVSRAQGFIALSRLVQHFRFSDERRDASRVDDTPSNARLVKPRTHGFLVEKR